jgi:hypothetical protein
MPAVSKSLDCTNAKVQSVKGFKDENDDLSGHC